jgi:hypothetical protein
MNERIKELAEQARKKPLGNSWCYTNLVEFEEKFAELIVKECLTVINQPNGVGDDDVIRISDDVKRHFGVEEQ